MATALNVHSAVILKKNNTQFESSVNDMGGIVLLRIEWQEISLAILFE